MQEHTPIYQFHGKNSFEETKIIFLSSATATGRLVSRHSIYMMHFFIAAASSLFVSSDG